MPWGNVQDTIFMAPDEPLVSAQEQSSSPENGPVVICNVSVRVACAIGMMIANRSTRREPSRRRHDQLNSSAINRIVLMLWTGPTLTSKSCVLLRTMNVLCRRISSILWRKVLRLCYRDLNCHWLTHAVIALAGRGFPLDKTRVKLFHRVSLC